MRRRVGTDGGRLAHMGTDRQRRRVAALVMIAGYAWWVAGLEHFTLAALVAVLLPGVAILAPSWWRRPRRSPPPPTDGRVAPWLVLAAALSAWELLAFSLSPRSTHPTLSSLADAALRPRLCEAVAFVAWLGLGRKLARQ